MKFRKDEKGNISAENITSVQLEVSEGDVIVTATDKGGYRWCLASFTQDGKLYRPDYIHPGLGFKLNRHSQIKLDKTER